MKQDNQILEFREALEVIYYYPLFYRWRNQSTEGWSVFFKSLGKLQSTNMNFRCLKACFPFFYTQLFCPANQCCRLITQWQWSYGFSSVFYHTDILQLVPGTKPKRNMQWNYFFKWLFLGILMMEYYSAIKINEPSSFKKLWRKIKCISLTKRWQSYKSSYYVISTTWCSRKGKTMETV